MTGSETISIIKRRRSIRSYTSEPVSDEDLQAIVEAGQYAPNAGDQAWHFTVVQNQELLARLNRAAKEGALLIDVPGIRELGMDLQFDCLYGAPVLVIVSCDGQSPIPLDADCAAATQNMLLAAESLGLGSCWIYFVLFAFSTPQGPELMEELKIPTGYKPYDAALFGHKQFEVTEIPARKPDRVTYIR